MQTAFVSHLAGVLCEEPTPDALARKPLNLAMRAPLPPLLRAYIFAATSPLGERSVGDYKSQLMVAGQGRQMTASWQRTPGVPVLLIGYAYDFDVWLLWDAGLHEPFAFSTNVQVKASLVYEAAAQGIAHQRKRLRSKPTEVIIGAHASRLAEGIQQRLSVTADRLAEGLL